MARYAVDRALTNRCFVFNSFSCETCRGIVSSAFQFNSSSCSCYCRKGVGNMSVKCRLTVGRQLTDSWPTVGLGELFFTMTVFLFSLSSSRSRARVRGEQRRWEKQGRKLSPHSISPPFYHLFALLDFFARRAWIWGQKDNRSRSSMEQVHSMHVSAKSTKSCYQNL